MEETREKILLLLKTKGVSLRFLSAGVGMSATGLNRTLKDGTLKVSILIKIAEFFEVPVYSFFNEDQNSTENIKFKKSPVLSALEDGKIKISLLPLIQEIFHCEFTEEFVLRVFKSFVLRVIKSEESVSFTLLFHYYVELAAENTEKSMRESDEFFSFVKYTINDILINRQIVKELLSQNILNLKDIFLEIRDYVDEISGELIAVTEMRLEDEKHEKDDHNMTNG